MFALDELGETRVRVMTYLDMMDFHLMNKLCSDNKVSEDNINQFVYLKLFTKMLKKASMMIGLLKLLRNLSLKYLRRSTKKSMVKELIRFIFKNNRLLELIFRGRNNFRLKRKVLLLSNKRNRKLIEEKTHKRIVSLMITNAHKILLINKLVGIKFKKVKLVLIKSTQMVKISIKRLNKASRSQWINFPEKKILLSQFPNCQCRHHKYKWKKYIFKDSRRPLSWSTTANT